MPSSAGWMKISLCYKSRDPLALWMDFITFGVKLTQEIEPGCPFAWIRSLITNAVNKKTQLHIIERRSTSPRNNILVLQEICKSHRITEC